MKFRPSSALLSCLLCLAVVLTLPLRAKAFELLEFLIDITISDPIISFDYSNLGAPNSGVLIQNPSEQELDVKSSLLPQLGLGVDEDLQQGFILYDGTLVLEVARHDDTPLQEALRTTYRMQVAPRMLDVRYIRNLFVRHHGMDTGPALVRARAARLSDARLMRFNETSERWIRAARAVSTSPRADVRFLPRMEPDGVLGHYGYYTKQDGTSYVWAVLDKNSRYAIGLNVDDDDDGIFNSEDNCRNDSNADQMDYDGDLLGDACDEDDDNDSIADIVDNCPLTPNPQQEDYDFDGVGDVCDEDSDGDGIDDSLDECPGTLADSIVDGFGCSIKDRCPCDGAWKNHGAFVKCTSHSVNGFVAAELLSIDEGEAVVSAAAVSQCGK